MHVTWKGGRDVAANAIHMTSSKESSPQTNCKAVPGACLTDNEAHLQLKSSYENNQPDGGGGATLDNAAVQ